MSLSPASTALLSASTYISILTHCRSICQCLSQRFVYTIYPVCHSARRAKDHVNKEGDV
jgi:hypothetical protein